MQALDCHGDWLVDYADGALSELQLAAADEHLAACPACQRELAALQTSGARLQSYFSTLSRTEHCSVLRVRPRWTTVAQRAAAVAACVAVVGVGYWLNRQARIDVGPFEVAGHDPAPRETIKDVPQTADHDDIAAEIARETQIARLRAAITILKDEPGMSERSAALQQYLSEAYQVDLELPAM
jgi:hypothetical protein